MEYFAYSQKAFVYKYVVMLSDADQFKHMSFANYLKLMFLATDALCLSCLNPDFLRKNRLRLITSKMQFKKQTAPGDNILVKVNSSEIQNVCFSLLYTFVIEGSAELVALGKQVYEISFLNNKPTNELPTTFQNILMPIQTNEEHLLYKY